MTMNKSFVENSVSKSLKILKSEIHTLFFHSVEDTKTFLKDIQFFLNLKKKFPIKNLGFSVYEPNDLREILKKNIKISIQFPFNILNQSFSKIINKKEIYPSFARSIFLQGILLNKIKKKNNLKLSNSVKNYLNFLDYNKISPLELNLSFINQQKKIDYFIFGVDNADQLKKIISTDTYRFKNSKIKKIKSFFDKNNIDPRYW